MMPVLNHHIVATHDKEATARYFSEILGLKEAVKLGEFAVLKVSGDTTLDFRDSDSDDFDRLHYAFLVTEAEFDEIFGRIRDRGIDFWSDPMHEDAGQVNNWDDGRGVYFNDPNGHRLEIITRAYGSAGTEARHPHPLVAPKIGNGNGRNDVH
jgi:catechol 2,3-dioxygenase-like lactoylglutathione lyase family enzyme